MRIKSVLQKTRLNNRGEYPIAIYLFRGNKAYYYINFHIKEAQWNEASGLVKNTRPNYVEVNRNIMNIKNDLEKLMFDYPKLSATEIIKLYNNGGGGLVGFINTLIKESNKKPSTIQTYKATLRNIEYFNEKVTFNDINKDWYNKFIQYLKDQEYKPNTIGKNIKILKVFLNEAFDRGITTSQEHKKKYFVAQKIEVDSIYLNEKEIELIEKVDLSNRPELQHERDRFIVSYYFLLRFSDSISLSKEDIFEMQGKKFVKVRAVKTGHGVVIPIKPSVYSILERNNFEFKKDTNVESNWKIKEVCKLTEPPISKADLVTTHTARRSGATNLYIESVKTGKPPIKLIMDLGGWKKESSFKLYIRVDKLESAIMAADLDFFK